MFYIFACGIWVRYTVAAIFSGVQVGTASIYLEIWEKPKLLAEKASELEYIQIIWWYLTVSMKLGLIQQLSD